MHAQSFIDVFFTSASGYLAHLNSFHFEISFLLAHGRSLPEKCDGFEVSPRNPIFAEKVRKKVPNKGGKLFYEGENRCALRSPPKKFFRLPFLRVCGFPDCLILLCWGWEVTVCVCLVCKKKSLFALSDNRMRCSSASFLL